MRRVPRGPDSERAIEMPACGLGAQDAPLEQDPSAWPELLGRWRALREAVPRIVEQALRRLLDDELRTHPEHITETVRALLVRVRPDETELELRVHPNDLERLSKLSLPGVVVSPDAAIRPGGCVLASARARFDARLETRLQRVVAAISTASQNRHENDTPSRRLRG